MKTINLKRLLMFRNGNIGKAQNALPPSGEGRGREPVSRPAHSETSAGRECPVCWPAPHVTHPGGTPKSDTRNGSRCPLSYNDTALRPQQTEWRTPAKRPWDGPALAADRRARTLGGFTRLGLAFQNDMNHSGMFQNDIKHSQMVCCHSDILENDMSHSGMLWSVLECFVLFWNVMCHSRMQFIIFPIHSVYVMAAECRKLPLRMDRIKWNVSNIPACFHKIWEYFLSFCPFLSIPGVEKLPR